MFAIGLMVLAIVGGVLVFRGLRGGRAPAHPRCWQCRYDMRQAPTLRCPECGHEHAEPSELRRSRRRPGLVTLGALLAIGSVGLFWALAQRQPWYTLLPRPVLRLAVRASKPPLPAAPPGSMLPGLPAPSAAGTTAWDYLIWSEQVNQAVRGWAALLEARRDGVPEAELDGLLAAADQIDEVYDRTGGMPHVYGWMLRDAKGSIARDWRAAGTWSPPAAPAPGTVHADTRRWALAELQYDGSDYSHRPDWTTVPPELVEHVLKSDKPERRLWGLKRLDRRRPAPEAARLLPLVEHLAASDPDPKVRSRAEEALYWLRLDHDGRWGKPPEER